MSRLLVLGDGGQPQTPGQRPEGQRPRGGGQVQRLRRGVADLGEAPVCHPLVGQAQDWLGRQRDQADGRGRGRGPERAAAGEILQPV